MRHGMQAGAQQMSQRIKLWQELQLLWDEPGDNETPWPSRLERLAEEALQCKFSNTQAKAFENACNGARAYSDVFNYIYGQVGKDYSPWVVNGWPDKLLKLLKEMREEASRTVGGGDSLDDRLRRQNAVLLLYRKTGNFFAAYVAFLEKHRREAQRGGRR